MKNARTPIIIIMLILLLAPLALPAGGRRETQAAAAAATDSTAPDTAGRNGESGTSGRSALPATTGVPAPRDRPDTIPSSLSVEQAITIARAASGDLERARIALDQGEADIQIARARRLPAITGQASASYLVFPPDGIGLRAGELGTIPDPGGFPVRVPDSNVDLVPDPEPTFFRVSASLSQALVTWGKVQAGIEASQLERDRLRVDATDRERQLVTEVRRAYFGLVLARETVDLLRDTQDILDQITEDRRRGFDAGVRTRQEVLEVEAELAAVRRQRVSAEQGMRSARRGLSFLLGADVPEETELVSQPRTAETPDPDESEVLAEALRFSPQLRELGIRREQASVGLFVAERTNSLRYPDIGLSVNAEVSGGRIPFSFNWRDSWDTDLTLTLASEFSVFDGGAQAARVRQAEGDLAQAVSGLTDAEDGLRIEVSERIEAVRVAAAELAEAKAGLRLAEERRNNAEVSFENELITREDVLMARIGATIATLEVSAAAFQLEQARTGLDALTGRILNP
ncbi:MAG: TolC family protein [Spirochaetaceae bacterium]|nr:MAG: TolC family protein [Spirochaetaceae bacterium]